MIESPLRLSDFPFRENLFFLGAGIDLDTENIQRIYARLAPGNHFWVLGSTGSGKTVFQTLLDVQAVLNDLALIKADLKFSAENFYTLYVLSQLLKRNFYVISDRESHSYNPFLYGDTTAKVQKMLDLTTDTAGRREAYYEEVKKTLISSIVEALDSTGMKWSIRDVYACLLDSRVLKRLINLAKSSESIYFLKDLQERLDADNSNIKSQAMKEISALKHILSHLSRFHFLNTYTPDIHLRKIIENQDILYFVFPALIYRDTARSLARLFLSDVLSVIGELILENAYKRYGIRFMVSIDEFQMFLIKNIELLFSQSRAAGAVACVAHQSVYDLDFFASKEFRNIIATNTKSKVFFRLPDVDSVQVALSLAGKENQLKISVDEVMIGSTEHSILEIRELTTLPVFHFYAILEENFFRGHTYIVNDLSSLVGIKVPKPSIQMTYDRKNGIQLWEYYESLQA